MLTRDSILAANDTKLEKVAVPEWGGELFVRSFDGTARDQVEQHVLRDGEKPNTVGLRALVVALAACDDRGATIFTLADIPALAKKSSTALDRVFAAASKLNKLNDDGAERESFLSGQSAGSGSG